VLILLPPSQGKTAPQAGSPVDLAELSHPELTAARRRVGQALILASGRRNAARVLGAGPSLADEVARNTALWDNPAATAAEVYSGVLYEAAGAANWSPETAHRAAERVRIMSALWGIVSPADSIPAYRLSMGTALGRIGPLAAFWRERLAPTLTRESADHLVVDCRSSDYAAVWRGDKRSTLAVRVERDLNGKRSVVSHNAKHARGLLTAALIATHTEPNTPEQIAHLATQIPGISLVELRPGQITLVTEHL